MNAETETELRRDYPVWILELITGAAWALLMLALFTPAFGQSTDPSSSQSSAPMISWNNSLSIATSEPMNYTISAATMTAPRTLTIVRAKDCKLVILEDTAEKLVVGCRTELR